MTVFCVNKPFLGNIHVNEETLVQAVGCRIQTHTACI